MIYQLASMILLSNIGSSHIYHKIPHIFVLFTVKPEIIRTPGKF